MGARQMVRRRAPVHMAMQLEVDIEALRRGDAQAWRQVLEAWGPSLLGYATRLTGNRSEAEEVVQDALVKVYQAIGDFEGRCSPRSWLYRAVHNRAIDSIRRRRRYVDIVSDNEPDADRFDAAGHWADPVAPWRDPAGRRIDAQRLLCVVEQAMGELPHAHREVLLLKEVHGLTTEEICDALDISAGNLRIRLHRARKALRAHVDRVAPGAGED